MDVNKDGCDIEGAKEALATARKLIASRFSGIDEHEAIAYARGFTRGMYVAGMEEDEIQKQLVLLALKDKMLDAGEAYMGLNLAESFVNEAQ